MAWLRLYPEGCPTLYTLFLSYFLLISVFLNIILSPLNSLSKWSGKLIQNIILLTNNGFKEFLFTLNIYVNQDIHSVNAK